MEEARDQVNNDLRGLRVSSTECQNKRELSAEQEDVILPKKVSARYISF